MRSSVRIARCSALMRFRERGLTARGGVWGNAVEGEPRKVENRERDATG